MQATARRTHLNRKSVIALLSVIAIVGLCAFQFGDRYGLNSMPFAQVQALVSDLAKAQKMAKQGNVELLAGETTPGRAVSLRGEVTDVNCYLGSHTHAYDHAFCAKLCAAAGSPLLFVPDQGGQVYLVLTERNGVRLALAFPGSWSRAKHLRQKDCGRWRLKDLRSNFPREIKNLGGQL